jgi:hypothetical protein
MKISTIILIMLCVAAAFYVGRLVERTNALVAQIGQLQTRVGKLENIELRRAERLFWLKRAWGMIRHPFLRLA